MSVTGIEAPLLAINPTIAAFSVNFAFSGYQASPYRQFHRGISFNELAASLILLLSSFVPLLCIALDRSLASRLALTILIPVGFSSLLLLVIARRETNGGVLLKRMSRDRLVLRHLRKASGQIDKSHGIIKALKYDPEPGRPTHEFYWRLLPRANEQEPFNDTATLGIVALRNDDIVTFEKALVRYLEILQITSDFKPRAGFDHERAVEGGLWLLATSGFERIVCEVIEKDKVGVFISRALDRIIEKSIEATNRQKQCSPIGFLLLNTVFRLGRRGLELGNGSDADKPLSIARQVLYDGLIFLDGLGGEATIEHLEFNHHLESFPRMMQRYGSFAIARKDSNHLWKVLESLSWTGCYAVKYKHYDVCKECLRGLSQLGRESRSEKLECHWDKCAVLPWQHVDDKIHSITSWITRIDEPERGAWVELAEAALSRLHGFEVSMTMEGTGEQCQRSVTQTKTPCRLSFTDATSGTRTLDYSDFSMLKDFDLVKTHGGGGIVRMAPIPLRTEPSKKTDEKGA